jgi:hypothetical protein
MPLYRKMTAAEKQAALDRIMAMTAPFTPERKKAVDTYLGGPKVETRKGDRHKDPKAHSAKTAARARAKRAAAK